MPGQDVASRSPTPSHGTRAPTPFLLLVLDREGRILFSDGAAFAALGLGGSWGAGASVFQAMGDRADLLDGVRRALRGESGTIMLPAADGALPLWFEPRRRADGAIDGAVLLSAPSSPRPVPVLHERRLQVIFRQVPGAIWVTDRDLRITYACGRLRNTASVSRRAIIGTPLEEVLGPEDGGDVAIAHHREALGGRSVSFRYVLRGRSYEVQLDPLRNAYGRVVGCIGVGVDATERIRAQEELARSEARLAAAQRVAHLGVWDWDLERDEVVWTDELCRIYGVEPRTFGHRFEAFLRYVHPEDLDATRAAVLETLRSQRPFSIDHRIVRPDGKVRMLHSRGEVMSERGRPVHMTGICVDVTERWEATLRAARTASLLKATLEATADGLLVVDRTGKIAAFNQRFLAMWNIPDELAHRHEDDALIRHVLDQLENPLEFLERVRELYGSPLAESFDVLRFRDGRVFERYSGPQRLDGEIVGRVWSFRDVTDRERLLKRAVFLSDASRLLATLDVESALESVAQLALPYLGDACAIDLFDDKGPRRLLAASRDPDLEIPGELSRAVLAGHATIYAVGGVPHLSVPLLARESMLGTFTFAARNRSYLKADLDVAEELAGRASLAIENARLYKSARDALRSREEFLSIAAHEIRGPITSLHLAVQSLHQGQPSPSTRARLHELIEREDRRLARLVDELLDVARIRSGRLQFAYEDLELGTIVREVVSRLMPEITRSGSAISVSTEGPVNGQWDRMRVEQIVTNLLTNAVKFGLGRPIEVRVEAVGDLARLVVQDHGMGISPDNKARIFEPFERAASVRHYGGLGLGLYIVRNLVEGMGGSVQVESEPGAGATFTVELPRGGRAA